MKNSWAGSPAAEPVPPADVPAPRAGPKSPLGAEASLLIAAESPLCDGDTGRGAARGLLEGGVKPPRPFFSRRRPPLHPGVQQAQGQCGLALGGWGGPAPAQQQALTAELLGAEEGRSLPPAWAGLPVGTVTCKGLSSCKLKK